MAKSIRNPPKAQMDAVDAGHRIVQAHALFGALTGLATLQRAPLQPLAAEAFAEILLVAHPRYVTRSTGSDTHRTIIVLNSWRKLSPPEWANVIGQALLHIVLNDVDPKPRDLAARLADELATVDLLRSIGLGTRPDDLSYPVEGLPGRSREAIANHLRRTGPEMVAHYGGHGLGAYGLPAWRVEGAVPAFDQRERDRNTEHLARAIRQGLVAAVERAGDTGRAAGPGKRNPNSMAEEARRWFVASYPLLAALASAFEIVEDAEICARYEISIAAVDPSQRVIYINPKFAWDQAAMRFVIAHELLHVGLSHAPRRQGRDAYLWNVACDYVINGWLVEMGVGRLPTDGLLLDPDLGLEKESAEALYDRIVSDLRIKRKLAKAFTLAGRGRPDILGDETPAWWRGPGTDLDSFYRRALDEGIDLHARAGRGLLPGDMIEEIRSLNQPAIPWDVQLGQWLDNFFPPIERKRSFARASRRQSSTPDIPRPIWLRPDERLATRTFGAVIDTSGSMEPHILGRALGAIASYAMSRDVPLVRIVQCDARAFDMGFVEPERLLDRVEVKGRGGTILQPGIALLEAADDFPKDAPILIITDGACDHFQVRREHAILMPPGRRLPFRAQGPIFWFEA
jgi:predicted metal-dependent peptidase